MNIVKETDTLVAKSKTNLNKYWKGQVVEEGGIYYTRAVYWHDKSDGESSIVQYSEPYKATPTNVGKSNERNSKEQALFNLESDYNKQIDKGYNLPGTVVQMYPLSMLAHEYEKRKKSLGPRLCVQPKLDGVRASLRDKEMWSRNGKLFIPEVVSHLLINTNGEILDGELILPKPYTFQETMQAVKKYRDTSKLLEYHVFDLVDENLSFQERYAKLEKYSDIPGIKLVKTLNVENEDDIFKAHANFILEGYEGTIVRDLDAKYLIGHRSEYLLKYKDFQDDEFRIVAVLDGLGKEAGCAIFKCRTVEGLDFDCRPRGSVEYRKELFNNGINYIGKLLTVRYQNLTDEGVPRFPVGISVRPEWDITTQE